VDFQEIDLAEDVDAREDVIRLTGALGVPVIVVDGEVIRGFDKARLTTILGL
jgi:glutaredoxin